MTTRYYYFYYCPGILFLLPNRYVIAVPTLIVQDIRFVEKLKNN